MLCQNCGLKNATSIYMPPNQTKIKYLCGACYKKLNCDSELDNLAFVSAKSVKINLVCKNCGTSLKDFEESGLFGCENCYNTFEEHIKNFTLKFKETKYLGKKPNLYYVAQEIKNLENLIEMCLKNGNLQKATLYGKELERLKEENYDRL